MKSGCIFYFSEYLLYTVLLQIKINVILVAINHIFDCICPQVYILKKKNFQLVNRANF